MTQNVENNWETVYLIYIIIISVNLRFVFPPCVKKITKQCREREKKKKDLSRCKINIKI